MHSSWLLLLMVASNPALPHSGSPVLTVAIIGGHGMLLEKAQLELARCHETHAQQGYHPGRLKALSECTEKQGIQTPPRRRGAEGTRNIAMGFLVTKSKQEMW